MMLEDIQIDFWTVGQGDATTIRLPNGNYIIIDVGPIKNNPLVPWLKNQNMKIESIILTHNDADHCGALTSILDIAGNKINTILLLEDRERDKFKELFAKIIFMAKKGKILIGRLENQINHCKELWRDNEYVLLLKYPNFQEAILATTPNKSSAIITLKYKHDEIIIWGGDSTIEKISNLNDSNPKVLFGPHHGSPEDKANSKFPQNIKKLSPKQVFISFSTSNRYSHPATKYLKLLTKNKAYITCSEMATHCDRRFVKNTKHLMNVSAYYGLPSLTKNSYCRGHLRFTNGKVIPDRYEKKHKELVKKLKRTLCH